MAAANTLPDVTRTADVYTQPFASKKVLMNMQPLADRDKAFNVADIYPAMLNLGRTSVVPGGLFMLARGLDILVLFYNKALFKKAGIAQPPKTYSELLADCKKFKAAGILPLAYGDRDGYSTDNWVTYDYASYMSKGDIARIYARQLKYTDPKLVKPLEQLVKFKQQGCVNPDASTHENNDANTYFTSGKAAMVKVMGLPLDRAIRMRAIRRCCAR